MPGEYDLNDYLTPNAPSTLQHIRDALAAHHRDHAQRGALAQIGISEVESGIARLASLGHAFHLVPGPMSVVDRWPRMVYHATRAPDGHEVLCQQDLDELNNADGGWADTPQDAANRAGFATQLQGRGGISTGQAMVLVPTAAGPATTPGPRENSAPMAEPRFVAQPPTGPAVGVPSVQTKEPETPTAVDPNTVPLTPPIPPEPVHHDGDPAPEPPIHRDC